MSLYYKLSILMGTIVVISNYLVQFPIHYFKLSEILTYGAFSYPVTFLITDLATNFEDIISIRIAVGSGLAFFIAQNWT